MITSKSHINYLALLVHLQADQITEVRLVKNTYLVKYVRRGAKLALFVKTAVVLKVKSKSDITEFETMVAARTKKLDIKYNPVAKKVFVSDAITLRVYEILTIDELLNCNLSVLIESCLYEAKPRKKYSWFLGRIA